MKVVIVEDESIAARKLQRMLEQRGIDVVDHLASVKELSLFLDSKPSIDLFFFDIHLNDGIVFEALEGRELEAPIIFTTAYDQYAIKAFKQNSIDYLLKPINDEELDQAIAKFKKTQKSSLDLNHLAEVLLQKNSGDKATEYRERISIRIGDKIKSLNIAEVLFFYSENKMNFIFTKEGRTYPIDLTIEAISNQLNPKRFYRVNRGCIIAIDAIHEVIAYSNSRLKVKVAQAPEHEIVVSREKVKEFKSWLG